MSMSDDVLSLPAGRELDVKVAEALGLRVKREYPGGGRFVVVSERGCNYLLKYSTSGDEAVALAQRFWIWTFPDEDSPGAEGWQAGVPIGKYAKAPTIPHAVARWVARYVRNGEVSE